MPPSFPTTTNTLPQSLATLLPLLGHPLTPYLISDELNLLYTSRPASTDLGFIDRNSDIVNVSLGGGRWEVGVKQSLGVLRGGGRGGDGGNTGAVLWKVTPRFVDWLGHERNPLFENGVVEEGGTVLELGCGVGAVVGLGIAAATVGSGKLGGSRVGRVVLSDQGYVMKMARGNLEEGLEEVGCKWVLGRDWGAAGVEFLVGPKGGGKKVGDTAGGRPGRERRRKNGGRGGDITPPPSSTEDSHNQHQNHSRQLTISLITLDWELHSISDHPAFASSAPVHSHHPHPSHRSSRFPSPLSPSPPFSISLILSLDTIYNEALLDPFIQTCIEACLFHRPSVNDSHSTQSRPLSPTPLIIAIELRSPDVFEACLEKLIEKRFRVWRIPDGMLNLDKEKEGERKMGVGTPFVVLFCLLWGESDKEEV